MKADSQAGLSAVGGAVAAAGIAAWTIGLTKNPASQSLQILGYIIFSIGCAVIIVPMISLGFHRRNRKENLGTPETVASQVQVTEIQSAQPERQKQPESVKILFMAANPKDTPRLDINRELREISDELRRGKYRDSFTLEQRLGVGMKDISRLLLEYNPQIVHFSGHGSDGAIAVEDEFGYSSIISPDGLVTLFGIYAKFAKCVILMVGNSLRTAEALGSSIDRAIGLNGEISDESAITFSAGFYQGLSNGLSIDESFERGLAFIKASPSSHLGSGTPVLIKRTSTPPAFAVMPLRPPAE